jgi:hypothetical protein
LVRRLVVSSLVVTLGQADSKKHYLECFNIEVTGDGNATPSGAKFPGAYKHFRNDPGLYFDIYWGVTPYPIPGPPLYVPKEQAPALKALPHEVISPMGNMADDIFWYQQMFKEAMERDRGILSLNVQRPKHGPLPNMTGPTPGSVPKGAVVLGREYYLGDYAAPSGPDLPPPANEHGH